MTTSLEELDEHLEAVRVKFRIGCIVCGSKNDLLRPSRRECLNAPHMTPTKKLALATQSKLICENVMQSPHHLSNRHWPVLIAHAFPRYASAFVDCNLEDSPESCRSVVEQMNRECVEYLSWAYSPEIASKPRMEYASLFGAVANSTKTVIRELQTNTYGRMMNCAYELKRLELVDEFYDSASSCAEGSTVPGMLAIRLTYILTVLTRARNQAAHPLKLLASMKKQKSLVLCKSKPLNKALTLATQECKLNNDFANWSRAMGCWLKYYAMSGLKGDADECAKLMLKMHPCSRRVLCAEAFEAKNAINAPHITPEKKLALATRAKLICEDVMQWPRHLSNRHWPDFISPAFSEYASAFMDYNLEVSPESCRSVVEKMDRQCVEYNRWANPFDTASKPRVEYGSFGTMAQVEYHVGNYDITLARYFSKTFVRELQTNTYARMMDCANALKKAELADEFYDSVCSCAEGITVPEMRFIRLGYIQTVLTRIDGAHCSMMMASQRHGNKPITPELLAFMKTQKTILLRNNPLLEKALTLATQECKDINDFASWSRAMEFWLNYYAMSDLKNDADECARLVLKVHPCARGVLCTDALGAKETLRAEKLSDNDVGRITSTKEGCCEPVATEWARYRKEK
ncbi:hypothetical protein HDU98_004052 [Podochytrium sp. JEL0797]|nr:hypothetical protein HDU98_004052 [Podochytrium sp. JEL0797]